MKQKKLIIKNMSISFKKSELKVRAFLLFIKNNNKPKPANTILVPTPNGNPKS